VEYRKGRPFRARFTREDEDGDDETLAAPQPWPTDRVQVGLQALLLEEAGYEVPEIVLYYAAERRRVTVPFDDGLRAETLATLAAAKATAAGQRPLPLVNDPRCAGCSLQPICLPDEIHDQRGTAKIEHPRPLWPPHADGIQVVVQKDGARVGVRGETLRVTDRDGKVVREVPLAGVESVAILGAVQLSTQAAQVLGDRGVPVAYMTGGGRLAAILDPVDSVSATVRRAQVRGLDLADKALELGRAVVAAKIVNQRTLVLRNHPTLPDSAAAEMAREAESATSATTMDALRGHEGRAARLYFDNFGGALKVRLADEFNANGRERRPAPDPINACLSFGYSMLTSECVAALRQARLEPAIGALHVSKPGRPALALDLMEPFRPLVVDSVVVTAFNRGELVEGHFQRTAAGCVMTDAGRKAFFQVYGRRMNAEVTHGVFEYRLSYRRMLILHARMIAAWLVGEVPTLAFLTTR
jgi:CRISPR-associated protein Cas1